MDKTFLYKGTSYPVMTLASAAKEHERQAKLGNDEHIIDTGSYGGTSGEYIAVDPPRKEG